jgi:hypothetical protein
MNGHRQAEQRKRIDWPIKEPIPRWLGEVHHADGVLEYAPLVIELRDLATSDVITRIV